MGVAPISSDEFRALRAARPWWRRRGEAINIHARCQYRIALAELHGNRRLRGSARMAWAALCAPRLTFERITRILQPRPRANSSCRNIVESSDFVASRSSMYEFENANEAAEAIGGIAQ
jgi:hypothetical protein